VKKTAEDSKYLINKYRHLLLKISFGHVEYLNQFQCLELLLNRDSLLFYFESSDPYQLLMNVELCLRYHNLTVHVDHQYY
jgi:hypothetical protein